MTTVSSPQPQPFARLLAWLSQPWRRLPAAPSARGSDDGCAICRNAHVEIGVLACGQEYL